MVRNNRQERKEVKEKKNIITQRRENEKRAFQNSSQRRNSRIKGRCTAKNTEAYNSDILGKRNTAHCLKKEPLANESKKQRQQQRQLRRRRRQQQQQQQQQQQKRKQTAEKKSQ